jgi:hypothetical protein
MVMRSVGSLPCGANSAGALRSGPMEAMMAAEQQMQRQEEKHPQQKQRNGMEPRKFQSCESPSLLTLVFARFQHLPKRTVTSLFCQAGGKT